MKNILLVLLFLPLLASCEAFGGVRTDADLEGKAYETLNPKWCEDVSKKDISEVCTITVIGRLLSENKLTEQTCQNIRHRQNHYDCYMYLSEQDNQLEPCLNIDDKTQQQLCLGGTDRFFHESIQMPTGLNLCRKLLVAQGQDWYDKCKVAYTIKNSHKDIDVCMDIESHQSFYTCVKRVASFAENSSLCQVLEQKMPFPANFPPLVFSVNGCKYWVEHNESYKGLEEPLS